MKQAAAALLILLLLPACALAFDLSAYEVPGSGKDYGSHVTPIAPGSALVNLPSMAIYLPDAAALVRDGEIIEEIAFPHDPDLYVDYSPYLKADGTMGACCRVQTEDFAFDPPGFALYDVQGGALTNKRRIEGEPTSFAVEGGAFVGLRESEEQNAVLLLYSEDGQIRHTYQLPSLRARLQGICMDGGDLLLMLELWEGIPQAQMLTLRIDPAGQILWQFWQENKPLQSYIQVFRSGDGGAFLLASDAEDYKVKHLALVGTDGQICWEKTFSVPKAIFSIHETIPHPQTQSVALVGTVIADSRKLYNAFTMEIGLDGNLLSLDVRDFSARGDYNFSCKLDQSGVPYAVSDSLVFPKRKEGEKSVMVPLNELPKASDPGIQIR